MEKSSILALVTSWANLEITVCSKAVTDNQAQRNSYPKTK